MHCETTAYGDQAQDARFHALTCIRAQGIVTKRHDHLRDVLASALRRMFGPHTVQVEPAMGPGLRRPDIILTLGGTRTFLIDVAVANPVAQQYLNRNSDRVVLAAASDFETRKRRQYELTLQALNLQPSALVPFVVEATGRFGDAAMEFLDLIELDPQCRQDIAIGSTVKFLISHLRLCLHRGNAMCLRLLRSESRVYGTGGVGVGVGVEVEMPVLAPDLDVAADTTAAAADFATAEPPQLILQDHQ